MYQEHEIDPQLSGWFKAFGETPPMDERRRSEQRVIFLTQAQQLALTVHRGTTTVPHGLVFPLRSRLNHLFGPKSRLQFVAALVGVLIMLICAGGLTAYAAEGSLPDEPLYPVKLWSEAVRLELAGAQQDWQLALRFAERRAVEMRHMVANEQPLPVTLQARLMLQIDQAVQLAVSRPDDEARRALEQVRLSLEEQEQEMAMLQGGFSPQVDAELTRARETIRERIRWVESGIQEPNQLREQFRLRLQDHEITPGAQEQHRYGTPTPGNGNGEGQGGNPWTTGTPTPGSGYGGGSGSNPWSTGTPTPDNGYGGGSGSNPWSTGTTTPGNGYGDGQGGNPWTTGTPTPGSGYGEGQGGNPWTTSTPTPYSGYGDGSESNPWTTGTPTPGSSYGGGSGSNPWTTGTPTPGSSYGGGSGSNPWTTGTPTPGSSYGGGSGSNPTSTPAGQGGSGQR